MLSFFKKNKNKNIRGKSYYDRENMVHNLSDFTTIFKPDSLAQYTSAETIVFSGIALSEIDEKKINLEFKDPDFVLDEKEGLNGHKVLFYRHIVNSLIFLMQFHFLKGSFLFVSNATSSSTLLSHSDKISFANRIAKKYLSEDFIDFDKGLEIKISDKHNNYLNIKDGVNFRVDYVNNSEYNQALLKNPNLAKELLDNNFDSKLDDYF